MIILCWSEDECIDGNNLDGDVDNDNDCNNLSYLVTSLALTDRLSSFLVSIAICVAQYVLYLVLITCLLQAKDIYRTYFDVTAVDRIKFDSDIVEGLKTSKCI